MVEPGALLICNTPSAIMRKKISPTEWSHLRLKNSSLFQFVKSWIMLPNYLWGQEYSLKEGPNEKSNFRRSAPATTRPTTRLFIWGVERFKQSSLR
jgi:hypothetical protein